MVEVANGVDVLVTGLVVVIGDRMMPVWHVLSHGLSMRLARMQIFAIAPQMGFRMVKEKE